MVKKIGILGDIGSGKSYVAKLFGYPVFNADFEVAKLYKKDRKYLWTFNTYDEKEDEFTDRNVFPVGCIKELKKIEV